MAMTLNKHVARTLSAFAIVGTFGLAAWGGSAIASAAPRGDSSDVYAFEVGDDNADGVIEEDESGWDCTMMGNHVCGPDNVQGAPAGVFDDGGVLVSPWPSHR